MKTICFDFDGVIAHYDGWKGVDVFGKPNWDVVDAMKQLKASLNYSIIIWTTRRVTPALKAYLTRNNIPYDSINSSRHNPPGTSSKPIYHAFIDDRAIGYRGQKTAKLIRSIEHLVSGEQETMAAPVEQKEPVCLG